MDMLLHLHTCQFWYDIISVIWFEHTYSESPFRGKYEKLYVMLIPCSYSKFWISENWVWKGFIVSIKKNFLLWIIIHFYIFRNTKRFKIIFTCKILWKKKTLSFLVKYKETYLAIRIEPGSTSSKVTKTTSWEVAQW
jgi:hypothetical protein